MGVDRRRVDEDHALRTRKRITIVHVLMMYITLLSVMCLLTSVFHGYTQSTAYRCDANGGKNIGVRDGGGQGAAAPPNSGSLSTYIRAESRHYSGKTQYLCE